MPAEQAVARPADQEGRRPAAPRTHLAGPRNDGGDDADGSSWPMSPVDGWSRAGAVAFVALGNLAAACPSGPSSSSLVKSSSSWKRRHRAGCEKDEAEDPGEP